MSASAVEDIRRNIEYNDLSPKGLKSLPCTENVEEKDIKPNSFWTRAQIEEARDGKVRVNEGDAWCVIPWSPLHSDSSLTRFVAHSVFMYQHRGEDQRFDCVDLDPYGSAVPFLDAAMNAIADGGETASVRVDVFRMLTCSSPADQG